MFKIYKKNEMEDHNKILQMRKDYNIVFIGILRNIDLLMNAIYSCQQ